jgi:hypothetical protein
VNGLLQHNFSHEFLMCIISRVRTAFSNFFKILDSVSLEWRSLPLTGPAPAPRCGHSATMVEKRMLIFGGRGLYSYSQLYS